MTDEADNAGRRLPGWLHMSLVALCGLLVVFSAGAMAGALAAAREDDEVTSALTLGIIAAFLAIGVAAAWGGWKLYTGRPPEPEAPRVRTSRLMLVLGGVLGGILGLGMAISTDATGTGSLFSDAPVPATVAAIGILVWLVGGLATTLVWLRSIDEHEMQANNAGAMAALMTYLFVEPSWWLGWRGGILPEQQPMLTFMIVLGVYTTVWLWRRYR